MSEVVLRMEHITREFPGVRALDDVNFEGSRAVWYRDHSSGVQSLS